MSRLNFNQSLLEKCLKKDEAIILRKLKEINGSSIIVFKCKCNNNFNKKFNQLYKTGAFCKTCTYKIAYEKRKNTNIKNFGCENPSQSEEIKEKKKLTNLERRGVENPLQLRVIRDKIKVTNIEKYGVENPFQSKEIKERIKEINIEKYGCEYLLQSEEIKQKIKLTNIKKYGYENPFKSEEIKKRIKVTNIKNFGCENPSQSEEIKEKKKLTNLERRCVEHPLQSKEIINKIKATNLEKYGVEHPLQNSEIAEKASKSSYKRKEIKTPNGNIIYLQGYEPYAYKILLKKYKEDEIICSKKEVPEIWWENNKIKHRYYPDFYIKKDNLLIEVKSIRTFTLDDKQEKIEKSIKACKDLGYNIEIWILNVKGEVIYYIW